MLRIEPMTVDRTFLGREDHGIFTFTLHCSGPACGVGVGNYCLDTLVTDADGNRHRVPLREGFAVLLEILRVLGVNSWEELPGKDIGVLFDGNLSVGVSNLETGEDLVFSDCVNATRQLLGG